MHNFGKILHATTASGFLVNNLKMTQLTPDQAAQFYGVHRDKPFFECVPRSGRESFCVPRPAVAGVSFVGP